MTQTNANDGELDKMIDDLLAWYEGWEGAVLSRKKFKAAIKSLLERRELAGKIETLILLREFARQNNFDRDIIDGYIKGSIGVWEAELSQRGGGKE